MFVGGDQLGFPVMDKHNLWEKPLMHHHGIVKDSPSHQSPAFVFGGMGRDVSWQLKSTSFQGSFISRSKEPGNDFDLFKEVHVLGLVNQFKL